MTLALVAEQQPPGRQAELVCSLAGSHHLFVERQRRHVDPVHRQAFTDLATLAVHGAEARGIISVAIDAFG